MTAVRQIERLGFRARDVRHIVLTHLDFDHAGGLDDFPEARIHLLQAECDHAVQQETWLDRQRFRPQQWGSRERWRLHQPGEGDTWFGFNAVRPVEELPGIALIPLFGTRSVTPASRSKPGEAGCCRRVMRTFTAAKWISNRRIARRDCASTSS